MQAGPDRDNIDRPTDQHIFQQGDDAIQFDQYGKIIFTPEKLC